jgi:hypothetical protein
MHIYYGVVNRKYSGVTDPLYIANALNVFPVGGKYLLYKRVNSVPASAEAWASNHDRSFVYEKGAVAVVDDADEDRTESCSKGIHVSTPFYWSRGDTLIAVEVAVEDIITCLEGKLRVRRARVLGQVSM